MSVHRGGLYLDQDIAASQQLERLQRGTIWTHLRVAYIAQILSTAGAGKKKAVRSTHQPFSPLDKTLLCPCRTTNLDHVANHLVL